MLDTITTSTPNLSRLRKNIGGSILRRSLIPHKDVLHDETNDDEAERSSLVASERAVVMSSPQRQASPRHAHKGRDTMSSSPQKEHFQGCLKMFAENKINKDNAWNLQLIDFMTTMLRKHDTLIENLQSASTLVDASARIYSFRVDGIHYEVLKMAGGLSKAAQSKRGKKDDDGPSQDEGAVDGDSAAPVKKKKKKCKGAIAANGEGLCGDCDTNYCTDPFFERLSATAGDITSSNRAFNATLQIHDNTLTLLIRTSDEFLEPIEENIPKDIDLPVNKVKVIIMPALTENDQICIPFHKFSISNWDPDSEAIDSTSPWAEDNHLNLSQQAVAFDVNAEVEPIPQVEPVNDLLEEEPMGGLESDEECDVGVAACVARAGAAAATVACLTEMRPAAPQHARLEYSYCGAVLAAWAGPSHWRLKNNRVSKMSERTHSIGVRVEGERKKPTRRSRQLSFLTEGLAFDARAPPPEHEPAPPTKITLSRKTLVTGPAWNKDNFKTPVDRGLDESHFRKLFLRRRVLLPRLRELERPSLLKQPSISPSEPLALSAEPPAPLTLDENKDYDYNNENDASYCPNNVPDDDEWGNCESEAAGALHEQKHEPLGDMLEPPTKIAKIFIPYAMRAKKVDMKQLKHCTWKLLTEKTVEDRENKENVTPTTFSSIYTRLPTKLSSNMQESLSVPLALLSILHLANEKGLVLEKKDDLKDIGIIGLLK